MWFCEVLCVFVFFLNVEAQNLGGFCRTPTGESAKCVNVYECEPILALLRISSRTQEQTSFLTDSKCGFNSAGVPFVCCGTSVNPVVTTDVGDTNYTPNPSIPSRNDCGWQAENRIFNGEIAELDEFPWMAVVEYLKPDGSRRISCGGSLINNRYVLTAAHCIIGQVLVKVGQPINIRLGDFNVTNPGRDCIFIKGRQSCNLPVVNAGIEKLIPHPLYTRDNNRMHDIALIRLNKNIQYSEYVQPVCLPLPNEASTTGEILTVAGWGKTESGRNSDVKLKLRVPVVDRSSCANVFGRLFVDISDKQICAGGENQKDSCTGDSGGPLMRLLPTDETRWMIEGLVSFGYNYCGTSGYPGVYTKIAKYIPWIHNTVKP